MDELEQLRKYFLGELRIEKEEEIERRLILDAEFEKDLIAAENDLVEEYLDGVLSAEEAGLFANNYLITPERKKNVEFVADLREYTKSRAIDTAISVTESKDHFGGRLRLAFSTVPAAIYAACLLLFVIAAAGYLWLRSGNEFERTQVEYAALNTGDFSDLGQFSDFTRVTILPGGLRGNGTRVRTGEKATADKVFVRLGMPFEFRDYVTFDLRLKTESRDLLTFPSLRAYESDGGKELRFLLPSSSLTPGEYRFEIAPTGKGSSQVTYYFTVE